MKSVGSTGEETTCAAEKDFHKRGEEMTSEVTMVVKTQVIRMGAERITWTLIQAGIIPTNGHLMIGGRENGKSKS
jgi:hypothetical protein